MRFSPFLWLLASLVASAFADEPRFGLEAREAWDNSHFRGSPEPPEPFRAERIWTDLQFDQPIEMAYEPGSSRVYIAEQRGRILSFDSQDPKPTELANLRRHYPRFNELYGLAFHPKFASNRQIFLCYVTQADAPDGTRVSRFRVTRENPPKLDLANEEVLMTWLGGGHNGGSLQFGQEGYLYVSSGDGKGPNPPDALGTGQDCSDLLSSILRIDVDRQEPPLAYGLPPDNPFLRKENVRPEIWSFGFRNPWKMSFDRKSGELWVADVGWDMWELVYRVEKGANYGWSVMEGASQPINATWPKGPSPISPPTYQHPHSEARSITGGFVYRGAKFSELVGAYVYGDYETGKVWALRKEGSKAPQVKELMDTNIRIVCFGQDHQGEIQIVDHGGGIYALAKNDAVVAGEFPRKLSASGLFRDLAGQVPSPGVVPYSINAQMWADGATSERWMATPGTEKIKTGEKPWKFPEGSVLAKTLSLELSKGDPTSRRRLETQVLQFQQGQWNAYTYAWNDEQTDAELVDKAGRDVTLTVRDPQAPGGERSQRWRFASRSECLSCHYFHNGTVLGVHTAQLNRTHAYDEIADNQLRTLAKIGLIDHDGESAKRLADPYATSGDIEERARTYLDINCSLCHMPNGGGMVPMHLAKDIPIVEMKAIGETPLRGFFGLDSAKIVSPGRPDQSTLYYRMAKSGSGRMPHLGSSVVDQRGLELIRQWIARMPSETRQPRPPHSEAELDGLLERPGGALALVSLLDHGKLPASLREAALTKAATIMDPGVRDILRRFLPGGSADEPVDPAKVLALVGDADRGDQWLRGARGAACMVCHQLGDWGKSVGPSFDKIGARATRQQLLESILEPSKNIDPAYVLQTITKKDGQVAIGFISRREGEKLWLKDATGQESQLSSAEVAVTQAIPTSLMPSGLLQGVPPQEIADLLAFLSSLR